MGFAKTPLAVVQKVSGGAFMITPKGRTIAVQKGQHIYDFAQISTTLGAQVSFNDYYDHQFHLSGAGSIKFMNRSIELRRGYLWFQALGQNNHGFHIQTANSQVGLAPGEGIISFDPALDKTQFLSLKGKFIFGNLMDAQLNVRVSSGQFSFVDLDYQEGIPRVPTPVGQESFSKIVGLFNQVNPMNGTQETSRYQFVTNTQETSYPQRKPASVDSAENKSSIRFLPLKHSPELKSKRKSLLKAYREEKEDKSSPKRAPAKAKTQKSPGVPINVYGAPSPVKESKKLEPKRAPASIKPSKEVEKIIEKARKPASVSPKRQMDAFEKTLRNEYKEQKRHPKEVNQLIDELKSFKQDFQQDY